MSDRRLLAYSGRVADEALRGEVEAEAFVVPEREGLLGSAWLHAEPEGAIDRELLFGDAFDVIERRGDWAFGRSAKDGYCGWIEAVWLGAWVEPTHRVAVRTTWGYGAPDFKIPRTLPLHLSAGVRVLEERGAWAEIAVGPGTLWVPVRHLSAGPVEMVAAARAMLGVPYVWAGNSGFGIDCSGLVQVAAHAAGLWAAGDSDLQEAISGLALTEGATMEAGDLIFWKGHVALVTGRETMIHANAHHMMVVEEPIAEGVARIASGETGAITSRLRPAWRVLSGVSAGQSR